MNTKIIRLDPDELTNKYDMYDFMCEHLDCPSHFGKNLDALHDILSEIDEEIDWIITMEDLQELSQDDYGYRTLMVIADACDENENLHLRFEK